ncbi:MAG: molybdate ABC transporter substrate-binding protein, partial [Cyanobacteria bacterium J06635_11]
MPRLRTPHRLVQQLSRLVGSLLATAVALVSCTPASMTEAHTNADATQKTSHHQSPNRHQRVQKTSLTISAAASLQDALTAIEPRFQQAHPDIEIVYNWGGSGTLQQQIEQGAPADIFFPASQAQMQALARKNLLHRPLRKASSQAILGN